MKRTIILLTIMRTILILVIMMIFSLFAMSNPKNHRNTVISENHRDTVIIELDDETKIIIYTKDKEGLKSLRNYDVNKMVSDLYKELDDSVKYLEIDEEKEKVFINENEFSMQEWKKEDDDDEDGDDLHFDIGYLTIDIDVDELEDLDEEDLKSIKKVTYEKIYDDNRKFIFSVDVGFNNWLEKGKFPDNNNAPYSLKGFGSWYIGFNAINVAHLSGILFLDYGGGVSWYNWKLQDADFIFQETADRVEVNPIAATRAGRKSKLTASYINFQVIPVFDFSRGKKKVTAIETKGIKIKKQKRQGFRFGIGGYAGYRIGSHSKLVYTENDDEKKLKERENFFLKSFRYGIRTQLEWNVVKLFAMYDLNETFTNTKGFSGNQLNSLSFGFTFSEN